MPRHSLTLALALALGCSATNGAREARRGPQNPREPTAAEVPGPTNVPSPAHFVTTAELWAPDERVLGVLVSMRESPAGEASDFLLPNGDLDPGDARAVLFGARLIREGGAILSAATNETPLRFELSRVSLAAPATVWLFREADLIGVERVEPCNGCAAWSSSPAHFVLVVPDGQQLSATPEPGWTIAISP